MTSPRLPPRAKRGSAPSPNTTRPRSRRGLMKSMQHSNGRDRQDEQRGPTSATTQREHKERPMDDQGSPALQVALAYYDAWTSKDLERAMSYISSDIVCEAPPGRLEGTDAYRAFM